MRCWQEVGVVVLCWQEVGVVMFNMLLPLQSQYVFIHDAVLESIMCGDNSIPAPELRTKLQVYTHIGVVSKVYSRIHLVLRFCTVS